MRDTRASRVYVHCISLVEKERFAGRRHPARHGQRAKDAGEAATGGRELSLKSSTVESLAVLVRERDASGAMVDDAVGDGPDVMVPGQ